MIVRCVNAHTFNFLSLVHKKQFHIEYTHFNFLHEIYVEFVFKDSIVVVKSRNAFLYAFSNAFSSLLLVCK